MPTAPAPAAAPPKPAAKAAAKAAALTLPSSPPSSPSSSRSARQPASSRSTERRQGLLRSSWGSFAKARSQEKPFASQSAKQATRKFDSTKGFPGEGPTSARSESAKQPFSSRSAPPPRSPPNFGRSRRISLDRPAGFFAARAAADPPPPAPKPIPRNTKGQRLSSINGSPVPMPRMYRERKAEGISQWELSKEWEAIAAAKAKAAAEAKANGPDGKAMWNKAQTKGGLIGMLANAGQQDKVSEKEATPQETAALLPKVSEKVDALMRILSDWDAEFKMDGFIGKRDFRRALAVIGVQAERHVADAVFDMLNVKPRKKDESPSRSKSPTRESNKEKIEMHILDRGLRAAAGGSKGKRSNLLSGVEMQLFQDGSRTVQAQLRDALVANSIRVMDLFREWDENGDGEISVHEFRKALQIVGLHASTDAVQALFDEFDTDAGGTISFRELNRQMEGRPRRWSPKKRQVKTEDLLDIADLKRETKQHLIRGTAGIEILESKMQYDPLSGRYVKVVQILAVAGQSQRDALQYNCKCVCIDRDVRVIDGKKSKRRRQRRRGLRTYETGQKYGGRPSARSDVRVIRASPPRSGRPRGPSCGRIYLGARWLAAENACPLHTSASASRRPSMSAAACGGMGEGPRVAALPGRARMPALAQPHLPPV